MVVYNGGMDIKSMCSYCGKEVIRRKQADSANVKLHFCNMECKANYQRLSKPVTKEWLENQYIVNKLDTSQIGRLVNRDPKSVWNWLKDFGIPTRGRGYASATYQFKKGQPSAYKDRNYTPAMREKVRQARLKDGHYPKQGNGEPYWKGKQGEETNNWKGGVTPLRQKEYDKDEWKSLVSQVWKRDNAICRRCGLDHRIIKREEVSFAIHHIVSFADKQLRFNIDNLVLLCRPCHLFVHSKLNINKEFIKNA